MLIFRKNSIDVSVKDCMKVSSPEYWWKLNQFSWFIMFWTLIKKKCFFIFSFFSDFFGVKTCLNLKKTCFLHTKKFVVSNSEITSNNHGFMNFGDKSKFFNENTPNDPKNLIQRKNEFVCFPPFYDTKHKNLSILAEFVQNWKFLGNTQTIDKSLRAENKQTFL